LSLIPPPYVRFAILILHNLTSRRGHRIKRKRGEAALETLVVEQEDAAPRRRKRSAVSQLEQAFGELGSDQRVPGSAGHAPEPGDGAVASAPTIYARVDTLGAHDAEQLGRLLGAAAAFVP
jgi:hypothetical protein